jgi:hypothetical protein
MHPDTASKVIQTAPGVGDGTKAKFIMQSRV